MRLPAALAALAFALLAPVPASHAAPQPAMVPLGTVDLPGAQDIGGSSAVAFDGEVFYYTLGAASAARPILRVRVARNGLLLKATPLPPLHLGKGQDPNRMTYDATTRSLVVELTSADQTKVPLVRYDLRTGRVRPLFVRGDDGLWVGTAYDWSTRRYTGLGKAGLTEYDARGRTVAACAPPFESVSSAQMLPSAITTTGSGLTLLQAEDDTTITVLDRRCRTVGTYAHRTFAESTDENDAMACDGVTFGRPVVWMRDTDIGSMTAYALPDVTCPLPTRVSVAPAGALVGAAADVCATLSRAEVDRGIGSAVLAFRVGGALAGTSTTDANGRACLPVSAGVAARRVQVTYTGTPMWGASAGRANLTGYAVPAAPPPPRPRPVRVPPDRVPVRSLPGLPPGVAPLPGAAAPPAPPAPLPPAVQPAPLPNLQPLAGLAAAPGETTQQLAYATNDTSDGPAAFLAAAALTSMAGAFGVRTARATASAGR
jgi:hypothetical protein